MKQRQAQVQPFVLFVGVKDNPIPYEKKYRAKIAKCPKEHPLPKIKAAHSRNKTLNTA